MRIIYTAHRQLSTIGCTKLVFIFASTLVSLYQRAYTTVTATIYTTIIDILLNILRTPFCKNDEQIPLYHTVGTKIIASRILEASQYKYKMLATWLPGNHMAGSRHVDTILMVNKYTIPQFFCHFKLFENTYIIPSSNIMHNTVTTFRYYLHEI